MNKLINQKIFYKKPFIIQKINTFEYLNKINDKYKRIQY